MAAACTACTPPTRVLHTCHHSYGFASKPPESLGARAQLARLGQHGPRPLRRVVAAQHLLEEELDEHDLRVAQAEWEAEQDAPFGFMAHDDPDYWA